MIGNSFAIMESFLQVHGILAVFFLGFLEEIFFFIPSSFLFIALGFLMLDPQASLWPAVWAAFWQISLLTSAGVTLGALFIYGLVYGGGKPVIERYGKYFRISWDELEGFGRWFERGYTDDAVLVFFRAIPVFPITVISIFCGLIRIPFGKFVWTTFIGTVPRVVFLALLGWYAGKEYVKYVAQIAAVERYILFGLAVIATIFLVKLYWRSRK